MAKHPFTVSARMAKLIGRENVSNAEGAIIELVKNTYDADASDCILIFDNKFNDIPKRMSIKTYLSLKKEANFSLIEKSYTNLDSEFCINENLEESHLIELSFYFSDKNKIYIVDNGTGMSVSTVINNWMMIGTDNKENNYVSSTGRVKSGAKGIGRFALDRLGDSCRMFTKDKISNKSISVDITWSDFEKPSVPISDVYADINDIDNKDFILELNNVINHLPDKIKNEIHTKMNHGTILEISKLRDVWDNETINKVYENLETLVPPVEYGEFSIHLCHTLNNIEYGTILPALYDDYDYKINAIFDGIETFNITLSRNEIDWDLIHSDVFTLEEFKKWPYTKTNFSEKKFEYKLTIHELIPNIKNSNIVSDVAQIGSFDTTLYFMKRSSSQENKNKFYYLDKDYHARTGWMKKFGGIRLFRDNFKVRPYGEQNSVSFDWLGLGARVAKSPAAVTHLTGAWRIGPNQISGLVNTSRIENSNFGDKSSREGIIDNKTFSAFQEVLQRIIGIIERDRQYIMRGLDKFYDLQQNEEINVHKASIIAKKIIKKSIQDKLKVSTTDSKILLDKNSENMERQIENQDIDFLAKNYVALKQANKDLITEMQLLRGLASTGLVITSFAHELKNLSASVLPRTDDLKEILNDYIDYEMLKDVPEYNNPFIMIDDIKNEDERIKGWLDLSLNAVKKDKRSRNRVDLFTVFENFKRSWHSALTNQEVDLIIPKSESKKCYYNLFLIDIDSIFNNLIANSLDAFKTTTGIRKIKIDLAEEDERICIYYQDSGPGLSEDIKNPMDIFDSFFTTKVDIKTKKLIGTGLGMAIVKATVREYRGEIKLLETKQGFAIKIILPKKHREGFYE